MPRAGSAASSYAAAIKGSTSGLTRLVSDANAKLVGSGAKSSASASIPPPTISRPPKTDLPAMFEWLRRAAPSPPRSSRRSSRRRPIGFRSPRATRPAWSIHRRFSRAPRPARAPRGVRACNRTVKVFDGWTRFDIALTYKEIKAVDGGAENYAGAGGGLHGTLYSGCRAPLAKRAAIEHGRQPPARSLARPGREDRDPGALSHHDRHPLGDSSSWRPASRPAPPNSARRRLKQPL